MSISDYIALAIITVIAVAIIVYIARQKKKGVKCIGCPHGKNCCSCSGCTLDKDLDNTTK